MTFWYLLLVTLAASLYYLNEDNASVANWFMLLAILISTLHEKLIKKRKASSRKTSVKKQTETTS